MRYKVPQYSLYRTESCFNCNHARDCLRENIDLVSCTANRTIHIQMILNNPEYLKAVREPWDWRYSYDQRKALRNQKIGNFTKANKRPWLKYARQGITKEDFHGL